MIFFLKLEIIIARVSSNALIRVTFSKSLNQTYTDWAGADIYSDLPIIAQN
jgi:hypothetical protein